MQTQSLGLLPRLVLALALVGLVPLAVSAWFLISGNQRGLERSVFETHMVAVRSAVDRIEGHLEARRGLVKAVAASPVVADNPLSDGSIELIRGLLARLPDVASAAVVTDEGGLVVRLQQPGTPETIASLELQHRGQRIAVVEADGRNWVRLEEPIPQSNGSLVAVLDVLPFTRSLEHVTLLEKADMVLADGDGQSIAGAADVLAGLSSDVFTMAKERQVMGTSRTAGSLVAYDKVQVGDAVEWIVFSRQPTRVAFATTRKLRRDALLSILTASLLVVGLSALGYTSVVRPIRDLARGQAELAGTEHDAPKRNEIDQLRSSFAALQRGLRDRKDLSETFLGRYQVRDVLGTGAMGMVFRGWDPRLERPVALKTIRVDQAMGDEQRDKKTDQLVKEALNAAGLNDPHIVSIYDVEREADGAFISMELVDGMSLDEYLRRRGRLPQGDAARIGAAIARALATAHRNNLVHQDIKPANVLLGHDGQIKVTDFGISRLITSMSSQQTQAVFGTPGYLAPEALLGEAFDGRCDLYALGVVLYKCVAGEGLATGRTLTETMALTLRGVEHSPRDLGADIDEELDQLIMQLLEVDKDKRLSDAEAVAVRLDGFVPPSETLWRPESESGRTEGEEKKTRYETPAKSQMVPLAGHGSAGGIDHAKTQRTESGRIRTD